MVVEIMKILCYFFSFFILLSMDSNVKDFEESLRVINLESAVSYKLMLVLLGWD